MRNPSPPSRYVSILAAAVVLLLMLGGDGSPGCMADEAPDIRSVAPDLEVPKMTISSPAPGKRVKQVLDEYRQTDVYHALYLPVDWTPEQRYPLIVEYAGNGPYAGNHGDMHSGRVEGSKLGYGISAGRGFIWVCMPYLNNAGTANVTRWWGDKPEYRTAPTLDYCKRAVPWICRQYGGDPEAVILVGFSRGAIACNYLGLHDDEIARLWRAFVVYSHYDGVIENWGYPRADRAAARERLLRLAGRPQFICHETTPNEDRSLRATRQYLESTGVKAPFTFISTGFRNHDDAWILRPSPARAALREWVQDVLRGR